MLFIISVIIAVILFVKIGNWLHENGYGGAGDQFGDLF
jgi:hypothetical protein